jgi:hypothetical protein
MLALMQYRKSTRCATCDHLLAQGIMTTQVERVRAMAHAKAIFAVDNLKMSPIGEAVARLVVDGNLTPSDAVEAIVERHHLRRVAVSSPYGKQAGFSVAQ